MTYSVAYTGVADSALIWIVLYKVYVWEADLHMEAEVTQQQRKLLEADIKKQV